MFDLRRQKSRGRVATAIIAAGLFCLLTAGPTEAQEKSSVADGYSTSQSWSLSPRADRVNVSAEPASDEAKQFVAWVMVGRDNQNMPFVVIDKKNARVFVFDAGGQLLGDTPALLGLARGDDSAPGVGDKKLSDIKANERTTPAGRFVASLGYGLGKQDILWVDYASALALHRVLPANNKEHRLERLASTASTDHRITFGCINVPISFYDAVVHPAFLQMSGVVYILPEVKTISEVFATYASLPSVVGGAAGRTVRN